MSFFYTFGFKNGSKSAMPNPTKESDVLFLSQSYNYKYLPLI
jgi:hypothetical protein